LFTLIRGAEVWTPEKIGVRDVLVSNDVVVDIQDSFQLGGLSYREIDARGQWLVPGFVDSLTHITGGGGEGGFHTRTPEMQFSDAILGGVTTVNGVLGTDSISRSHENLIAKAKGLINEGLNVVCLSGSYQVPAKSLTESIQKDIMFISEYIGVGEIAISDHRSCQPSVEELAKLASEAKVAGLLSGKRGIVSIHVGAEESKLLPLWNVCQNYDVAISQFYPTHMNRNMELFQQGVIHTQKGGVIDFTASSNQSMIRSDELRASEAVKKALDEGVSPTQMTMSTDGHASLPVFNAEGDFVQLDVGRMDSLLKEFQHGVTQLGVPPELMLKTITQTPAQILGLKNVGYIGIGSRADILLLSPDDLELQWVMCGGDIVFEDQSLIRKGTFEL